MTHQLDSLASARVIEEKAVEAAARIEEALAAVRQAKLAISLSESEPDMKLPDFSDLEGLLSIGLMSVIQTRSRWAGYANARPRL